MRGLCPFGENLVWAQPLIAVTVKLLKISFLTSPRSEGSLVLDDVVDPVGREHPCTKLVYRCFGAGHSSLSRFGQRT